MMRFKIIGWSIALGVVPFGAGLYAIRNAHAVVGGVSILYSVTIAGAGVLLSRN